MAMSLPYLARSAIEESVVRLYFFAVVELTVTESLSCAAEAFSRVSFGSSLATAAALVVATVVGAALASR